MFKTNLWVFFFLFNNFFLCEENINLNPVSLYFNSLMDLMNILESNNPQNLFIQNEKKLIMDSVDGLQFHPKNLLIIMDFLLYDSLNNKNINSLWPELKEMENQEKIQEIIKNKRQYYEKIKKVRGYENLFKQSIQEISSDDNISEKLLSNYYFSIYTQKFFLIQSIKKFIEIEDPVILHSFFHFFSINFPESPYLIWMNVLVIISTYESLSPLLYQSEYTKFSQIFYLIKEIKKKIKTIEDTKYLPIIEEIETNCKLLQYERQMYKGIMLFNQGQISVGYNMLKKYLIKYDKVVNMSLNKYTAEEFIDFKSFENYHPKTMNYYLIDRFLMDSIPYPYGIFAKKKNKNYISIIIDTSIIKNTKSYAIYKRYEKILDKMDKILMEA